MFARALISLFARICYVLPQSFSNVMVSSDKAINVLVSPINFNNICQSIEC